MLVQSDMTYVHDMTSTYSHTYESLQSLHSDTLRSISVPGVPGLYVYIYMAGVWANPMDCNPPGSDHVCMLL